MFFNKKKKDKEVIATKDAGAVAFVNQFGNDDTVIDWFSNQPFIGWQSCQSIASHWLVSAACEIPVMDATRNGWDVTSNLGKKLNYSDMRKLKKSDKRINIKEKIKEFGVFGRVFGIRVAIFLIDGYDALDYEAPFNPDGLKKGCYKGILMPDPQFVVPLVTSNDPADINYYEPEYWQVSGIKYHKSHCVIYRHNNTLGQSLRPSYLYGSIPLPQQIYEQVQQAMIALSEGTKLLMTKRLWVQNGDIAAMIADQHETESRLKYITENRDNHGVQLIDMDDSISQFETALAGVADTIDQQLQVVAAIARIPVNKLMQSQLKGFASTGESEDRVYTETLESLHDKLLPLIEKHVLYSAISEGVADTELDVSFSPLRTSSDLDRAEINKALAEINRAYLEMGVVDSQEIRDKIIVDLNSGYSGLSQGLPDDY